MQYHNLRKKMSAGALMLCCGMLMGPQTVVYANTVSVHKNETTGLLTWTVDDTGFSIEFIQLLPDFIRAIYAKHDFPPVEIERAAGYCVFGTILKNTSDGIMSYRVADWRYRTADGEEYPVKTKTQWLDEWNKAGITFSWTLLPDQGDFEVGDWQQGFTTIKLPRETEFDLIYRWQLDGKPYQGVLENLKCAPESIELGE
jgi:hypothetical protein